MAIRGDILQGLAVIHPVEELRVTVQVDVHASVAFCLSVTCWDVAVYISFHDGGLSFISSVESVVGISALLLWLLFVATIMLRGRKLLRQQRSSSSCMYRCALLSSLAELGVGDFSYRFKLRFDAWRAPHLDIVLLVRKRVDTVQVVDAVYESCSDIVVDVSVIVTTSRKAFFAMCRLC